MWNGMFKIATCSCKTLVLFDTEIGKCGAREDSCANCEPDPYTHLEWFEVDEDYYVALYTVSFKNGHL